MASRRLSIISDDGPTAPARPRRAKARPPARPTAGQVLLAEHRAAICQTCSECKGIRRKHRGWPVYIVRCKACGCGGLSLIRGQCVRGKWDACGSTSENP